MGQIRGRHAPRRPLRTIAYTVLGLLALAAMAGGWLARAGVEERQLDLQALGDPRPASAPSVSRDGRSGSFSVLTHNVAGGPRWLTAVPASRTHPLIAERLNGYHLVLLQEDHTQHEALRRSAHHPYSSVLGPRGHRLFSDGLARFSQLPFVPVARHAFEACHGVLDAGRDCLSARGFSRAETRLADDAAVDVYNVSLDVGGEPADREARARQLDELAEALDLHSAGHAVLVAGDTALSPDSPEDAQLLADFLTRTGLRDACDALLCDASSPARILYRATPELALTPAAVSRAHELEGLSGHDAIAARFRWALEEPGQRAAILLR